MEPFHSATTTIGAICTPSGVGAIGVLRFSGKRSIPILKELFQRKTLSTPKGSPKREEPSWTPTPRKVYLGNIVDGEDTLDQVLVTLFQAPLSYTGEDIVEVSCHGGALVLEKILNAFLKKGAVLAEPGEFTERAYLNGKMDLLQVEAVEDIIHAESEAALLAAQDLISGTLSSLVQYFKSEIIHFISGLEAEIEFPEESDVSDQMDSIRLKRIHQIQSLMQHIDRLCDSSEVGFRLKEGFQVPMLGAPNTGKSTLMNQFMGFDRSLVSTQEGTTRDYIKEKILFQGMLINFIDMAGIRKTEEELESQGIQKSTDLLESASLIIFLLDGSRPINQDDHLAVQACPPETPIFWVINKSDQSVRMDCSVSWLKGKELHWISALTGEGVPELSDKIVSALTGPKHHKKPEFLLTHLRHKTSLVNSRQYLTDALSGIKKNRGVELIVSDLQQALTQLKILTGEITSDDIMNHIFENFCIGK